MKFFKDKKSLKWLKYILLGGFIIKSVSFVFKNNKLKKVGNNLKDFFGQEKKEVEELRKGEQGFKKYCKDSSKIFKNYFIPNNNNDFKPKILRTKPLVIITILLLFVKLSLASYLFLIYPNLAQMSAKMETQIYSLVNTERQINSTDILKESEILNEVARAKAEDMINKNYFAHESPDKKMIWETINRNKYPYLYVGENLAINFTSAKSAHKALMLSETHKKNILNSKYTEVGIAVVSGEIDNKKTNVLVQVFGHARPVRPVIAKKNISPKPVAIIEDDTHVKLIEEITGVLSAETESSPKILTASVQQVEISNQAGLTAKTINYSQYIFLVALIFLVIALVLNILIRISVQHKPVIIQTLLVIILTYGLFSIKLHFIESITENILIM